MALIRCSECDREISDKAEACPHCGNPIREKAAPKAEVLSCPHCNIQLIPVEKKSSISAGGIIAAFIFLIGLVVFFFNFIIGLLIMILSVILGAVGRKKKSVMTCPKCSYEY